MRVLSILFSLSLVSCGQLPTIFEPNNFPPVNVSGPTNTTLSPETPFAPSTNIGVVKCENFSQTNLFNKRLQAFLSTNMDPRQIGNHSCTKNLPGGVFFRGQVKTDKIFVPSGHNQDLIVVPEESYIEFHFETFSTNKTNVAPIRLRYTYGSIQGQEATLTFEDDKGAVHLDGQIKTHTNGKIVFNGSIQFENYQTWKGTKGYKGILGNFSIEACHFFQC